MIQFIFWDTGSHVVFTSSWPHGRSTSGCHCACASCPRGLQMWLLARARPRSRRRSDGGSICLSDRNRSLDPFLSVHCRRMTLPDALRVISCWRLQQIRQGASSRRVTSGEPWLEGTFSSFLKALNFDSMKTIICLQGRMSLITFLYARFYG